MFSKVVAVRLDHPRRDPHDLGEAVVDDRVGAADEAEGHRRGHARVALDDVRVVPDQPVAGRRTELLDGGDRPRLDDVQPSFAVQQNSTSCGRRYWRSMRQAEPRRLGHLAVREARPAAQLLGHRLAHEPAARARDRARAARACRRAPRRSSRPSFSIRKVSASSPARDQALARAPEGAQTTIRRCRRRVGSAVNSTRARARFDHPLHDDRQSAMTGERQAAFEPVGQRALVGTPTPRLRAPPSRTAPRRARRASSRACRRTTRPPRPRPPPRSARRGTARPRKWPRRGVRPRRAARPAARAATAPRGSRRPPPISPPARSIGPASSRRSARRSSRAARRRPVARWPRAPLRTPRW